jgi:DNA-binding NarL/FixJ family response regulator
MTVDLDEYVFEALRAGASGFLLKDSPPDTLISGIATVARGDALLAPSVTRRLIAEFGEATIKTYVSNILMKLGCRDRAQAVVAAYEAGLVQPGR